MAECTQHVENGAKSSRRLLLALAVIVVFMAVEFVGGLLSGSLALLADATHMLTDALALGLAASAAIFSARPADARLHFGYRRLQVLAAFVNGVLLTILLIWIVFEAVRRFFSPNEIDVSLMFWVAVAGLGANIAAFLILHRRDERDLNVRGAMLHVIGDLLGSAAAIIGAVIIGLTGAVRVDPILSIIVALLIGVSAVRLIRETGYILLEGAPKNIDVGALAESVIQSSDAIDDVHDVRIWQITPEQPRITLHIDVRDAASASDAIAAAKSHLADVYGITHSTIQIDVGGHCPDETAQETPIAVSQAVSANDAHRPTPATASLAANPP